MRWQFAWAVMLLVGLVARGVFVFGWAGNYDAESYLIVSEVVNRGGEVYTETTRYNYTPIWYLLLDAADALAVRLSVPLQWVVRGALSLVDVGCAALIGLIAHQPGGRRGFWAATAYFLNPGVVLITGLHGQFEVLAMVPVLLGLWLTQRRGVGFWPTTALFVLALLIKHNVIFVVYPLWVVLFGLRRALLGVLLGGMAVALALTPVLLAQPWGVTRNVLLYSGVASPFGAPLIVLMLTNLDIQGTPTTRLVTTVVMGLVVFTTPLLLRRQPPARVMMISVLAWFCVTTGMGIQYFTLLFMAAALAGGNTWLMLFAAVPVVVMEWLLTGALPKPWMTPIWMVCWGVCVVWLIAALVQLRPFSGSRAVATVGAGATD